MSYDCAQRRYLSAMLFHAALSSLLRRELAIWPHPTACLRSSSDGFMNRPPVQEFSRNSRPRRVSAVRTFHNFAASYRPLYCTCVGFGYALIGRALYLSSDESGTCKARRASAVTCPHSSKREQPRRQFGGCAFNLFGYTCPDRERPPKSRWAPAIAGLIATRRRSRPTR